MMDRRNFLKAGIVLGLGSSVLTEAKHRKVGSTQAMEQAMRVVRVGTIEAKGIVVTLKGFNFYREVTVAGWKRWRGTFDVDPNDENRNRVCDWLTDVTRVCFRVGPGLAVGLPGYVLAYRWERDEDGKETLAGSFISC